MDFFPDIFLRVGFFRNAYYAAFSKSIKICIKPYTFNRLKKVMRFFTRSIIHNDGISFAIIEVIFILTFVPWWFILFIAIR